MRIVTKKRAAAAAALIVLAGGGMAAYAYFTSSGSGTGAGGSVGTSTAFTVNNFSATGSLYPGDATGAAVTYRINNPSTGHQAVQAVTVSVASSGGNIVDDTTGNPVTGCTATWFSASTSTFTASGGGGVTLTADVAGGDYIVGHTTVTMSNVASTQDACQGKSPRLSVSVS